MTERIDYLGVAFATFAGVGGESRLGAGGIVGRLGLVAVLVRRLGFSRHVCHVEEVDGVILSYRVRALAHRKLEYLRCGDVIGLAVYLYTLAGCIGGAAEYKHESAVLGCVEGYVGRALYLETGGEAFAAKGHATL